MSTIKRQAAKAMAYTTTNTTSFIDGFLAPLHAMNFLRWHVALLRYTIIPVVLNVAIFGVGTWLIIMKFQNLTDALIPDTNGWWRTLLLIINILVGIIIIIAALILFSAVARIIAAPFNEQLSVATEAMIGRGRKDTERAEAHEETLTLKLIADDARRTIREETLKILFFLVVQAVILPINLIPAAGNIVYLLTSTPITWLYASFDSVDLPLARRKTTLSQRKAFMMRHKALFLGFGLASTLLLAAPILNLFFMPVLIVAGTTLFAQHEGEFDERSPKSR